MKEKNGIILPEKVTFEVLPGSLTYLLPGLPLVYT